MKEQLVKAMQRGQLMNMMYVSKSGEITKRRVKIIKVVGDSFTAFCFTRQAKRTFIINNVLAIVPVVRKERGVV
ncbi:putative DNA-binding transcriptional regulator YafY [Lysinibacillus parviboronicapiens]|uniref:DNA-binding transcriptional regulator YafY n=1 Tax=Lysinibacillus parviboronicapiens TaxID=436516 RepID=A0ABV2PF98_9BACI|nr:transcriptional regulator [Lysinibacillus parviboronicapiens]